MKKILMLIVVSYTIVNTYGQNEKKHYVDVHYLFGICNYHSENLELFSSREYNGTNYFGLGLDYRFLGTEKTEFGFGITATVNKMTLTSSYKGTSGFYYDNAFYIFSFPVHFKYHFLKYLFIGGGPCLNIHPSRGYKWGLGVEINAGMEYMLKSGLTVSITPRGQWNWLNVSGNRNDTRMNMNIDMGMNMNILSQIGINIGLGYRF